MLAQIDAMLKETREDLHAVALPNAAEAGMLRHWRRLGEIVAQGPAQAQPVSHHPDQLPFERIPVKNTMIRAGCSGRPCDP